MRLNIEKSNLKTVFLFLIWPVLGYITNFFNRSSKTKALIFVAFFCLVGYCFKLVEPEYDSYRYMLDFEDAVSFGIRHLVEYKLLIGSFDFYSVASYALIKTITSNPHILFAFWGGIFGFFMYKSFQFIIDSQREEHCNTLFMYGVILIMFLINPYININGVRYWTAVWLFFSSWLGYEVNNNDRKWLIAMCLSPFVHTTFLLPLVIFFVGKFRLFLNLKLLYYAYVISFVVGRIVGVDDLVSYIPFLDLSDKYSTYVDANYVESRNDAAAERSLINTILSSLPNYFMLIFISWLYITKTMFKYDKDDILTKTLRFALLMLCLCCISQSIPSMARFVKLCDLLFLFMMIIYKNRGDLNIRYLYPILFVVYFGHIYNIWFLHNGIISLKYLFPFAYLF